jgi:hypothetical protein
MQTTCGIFPIKNEGFLKKGIASTMEDYDL